MRDRILDALTERIALYLAAVAAVFLVAALVSVLAVWLVVRCRRKIVAVLYQDPAEFLHYTLRNLPALTAAGARAIAKFTVGRIFLAALAAGYAFLGFWLIETWFRLHGIARGGALEYSRIQVIGLVAGSVLASQLTLAALRGFVAAIRAFRNRYAPKPETVASVRELGVRPKSRMRIRLEDAFSTLFRSVADKFRLGRLGRLGKLALAAAIALALFETFVLRLRGAELAVTLGLIALLTFAALKFESRKRHA